MYIKPSRTPPITRRPSRARGLKSLKYLSRMQKSPFSWKKSTVTKITIFVKKEYTHEDRRTGRRKGQSWEIIMNPPEKGRKQLQSATKSCEWDENTRGKAGHFVTKFKDEGSPHESEMMNRSVSWQNLAKPSKLLPNPSEFLAKPTKFLTREYEVKFLMTKKRTRRVSDISHDVRNGERSGFVRISRDNASISSEQAKRELSPFRIKSCNNAYKFLKTNSTQLTRRTGFTKNEVDFASSPQILTKSRQNSLDLAIMLGSPQKQLSPVPTPLRSDPEVSEQDPTVHEYPI